MPDDAALAAAKPVALKCFSFLFEFIYVVASFLFKFTLNGSYHHGKFQLYLGVRVSQSLSVLQVTPTPINAGV